MGIEYSGKDKYRVLVCMSDRKISIKAIFVVKLSQQEIANVVQLSKSKVNSIISELKSDGYITQESPRGTYSLTNKAMAALAQVRKQINGGTQWTQAQEE